MIIHRPKLTIFPAMKASVGHADGTFVLTRKFLDGVLEYVDLWPGEVSIWIQREIHLNNNLDHVEVNPKDLPFRLNWLKSKDIERFHLAVDETSIVLAALVPENVDLAQLCVERNIPLVYITEYSVLTRRQIVRAETRNPILRWRRERWALNTEKKYCRAAGMAAGLQCNGLPTFTAYNILNQNVMLYFDTRVRHRQLVKDNVLEQRLLAMRNGAPLRLGFSGRLIAMKGVDHLPLVAKELLNLGVPFTMDICGGGKLESKLLESIRLLGLENHVRLLGNMDFEKELLPFVSSNLDIFVCCHRQGDPSCTYLETYSCGVPIVGYANEAFSGLAEMSEIGGAEWVTPMDDPVSLARKIAALNNKREEIESASRKAVAFAKFNTFEVTMAKRVQQLVKLNEDFTNYNNSSSNVYFQ
jgi:colanic acid/amylovoran biosynthesis glycosyltransferase